MVAEHTVPESQRDIVDLRSDTVTRPTPEMFEAMARMPVGDDVLGDDPTVQELERISAEKLGKEAALFVPSGTMGNQVALATHCRPGDSILIEEEAHILYYEGGSPAILSGVVSWTIPSNKGVMDPDYLEARVLKRSEHTPGTTLLCLENTHNRGGGTIIPLKSLAAYRNLADRHGLKVHLDGARVFNAAVALGVDVKEISQHVDTVNFCLSKGLRAPVGSVLCGPAKFIEEARFWRKRLGGGMRQAGLLAACGIVSITQMVDRLAEDHVRAKTLAASLSEVPGLTVDHERVQTNMVLAVTDRPAAEWQDRLRDRGVWAFAVAPNRMRLVLHADIDDAKLDRAVETFRTLA